MSRFAPAACAVLSAVLAASLWPAPACADGDPIALGRAIATRNCGRCHAIGAKGASANPKSPPFRMLSRHYPLADLEEALAEGIMVAHQGLEMPQFRLDPTQIQALLAYLASVQAKQ